MTAAHLTRRAALVLIAGVGVAACSPGPDGGDVTPTPDVDAGVLDEVIAREWTLVALYDAALSSQPGLAAELAALREQHVEHAAAFGSPAAPSATASVRPTTATDAASVTRLLADAEMVAARERAEACQAVSGRESARLLALIAASEAGHAAFLRRGSA